LPSNCSNACRHLPGWQAGTWWPSHNNTLSRGKDSIMAIKIKSLVIPRSVLIRCYKHWSRHTKRQGKQSPLICGTDTTQDVRVSYCKLSWEMKLLSAILNLKRSSSQWNGTIGHPQGRKSSRVSHLHEKSWLQYFMRKVLFLSPTWVGENSELSLL
jgi:hypothetical protein